MNFLRKIYYGDYDAIKGGANNATSSTEKQTSNSSFNSPVGVGGEWPLWEVFIRSKQGLDHKHVGSLHAADAYMAVENARDVYTRRQEGVSIWVVESKYIHASNPDEAESFYEPSSDKVYRHPTFYDLPDELTHM
jgi:ring-1,2-phenylacetyl-CoA epoxidase subunit PaaB